MRVALAGMLWVVAVEASVVALDGVFVTVALALAGGLIAWGAFGHRLKTVERAVDSKLDSERFEDFSVRMDERHVENQRWLRSIEAGQDRMEKSLEALLRKRAQARGTDD